MFRGGGGKGERKNLINKGSFMKIVCVGQFREVRNSKRRKDREGECCREIKFLEIVGKVNFEFCRCRD